MDSSEDSDIEVYTARSSRSQRSRLIPSQSQGKTSSQSQKLASAKSSKNQNAKDNLLHEYRMSTHEIVNNGVLYCLVMQQSKFPIKRTDFIKSAFENQCTTNYKVVMKELEDVLKDVFGLHLVGVNEDSNNTSKSVTSYILTSKFCSMTSRYVCKDRLIQTQDSILYMILAAIFMSGHSIEEDTIWKIMSELNLLPSSCTKREELHRFLKNTYMSPLYLNMETSTDGNEIVRYRYSWGFRAEMEFSRYKLLKSVLKYFPGTKPTDFPNQYTAIMNNSAEKELASKDEEEELTEDNMEYNYMNDDSMSQTE